MRQPLMIAGSLLALALTGCLRIPVTVHPPSNADGQPIALPTAPTGEVVKSDGTVDALNPAFPKPRPSDHPPAPGLDWGLIVNAILLMIGGGGGVGAIVMRGRAKRAEQSEDEVYRDLTGKAQPPSRTGSNSG